MDDNSEKNKILIVQSVYGKLSEVFLYRFYLALKEKFDTKILTEKLTNRNYFPIDDDQVAIFKKKSSFLQRVRSGIIRRLRLPYDYSGAANPIISIINSSKCDLVCFQFGYIPVALGMSLNRINKPICIIHHGSDLNKAVEDLSYRSRLNRVWTQCEKIIFSSRFLMNKAIELGCPEEKSMVHYMGVPVKTKMDTSDSKVNNESFRFICVARLAPVKNHINLIRAFAQIVQESNGKVELTLIGDGELSQRIKKENETLKVGNTVKMLGGLSNKEVLSEIATADCSILISSAYTIKGKLHEEEALGLSLLEGGAFGLPMIGGNSGGIPEIIENEINGYLVDPLNTDEIKKAMLKVLRNPEKSKEMGRNARKMIEKKFNLEIQNQELIQIMSKIIAS